MEYVVGILLGFITLSFLLKISFYGSFRYTVLIAILCSAFILLIWPYATEQSKTQIEDFLHSPKEMLDASVWITLESALMIGFCFNCFAYQSQHKTLFKRIVTCILKLYPGLLFGVVLSYTLTQIIYALPGVDFLQIAWYFAISISALIIILEWGLKIILPEYGLRLELLFVTNLFIIILGIIATENGQTYYRSVSNLDIKALLGTLSVIIGGMILGFIWKLISKKSI